MKIISCEKISSTYLVILYEKYSLWGKKLYKRSVFNLYDKWHFADTLTFCGESFDGFCDWIIKEGIKHISVIDSVIIKEEEE